MKKNSHTPTVLSNKFLNRIGKNIKSWRRLREIKLDRLSYQIGISKGMLSLIENGKTNFTLLTFFNIATTLQISESSLLSDPNELVTQVELEV